MTEIPIVVSTNEITVGGVVDQIELQLGLGEKGDRGSRIFSGDVSPLTLPANSLFFAGYTEFKPGDVYVERSATNIAMWEWKSQPGGYTWVKTADIAVSGGGGITSLDPDLTAIADLTGTTGLLRKSGVNTWLLDTNAYLTSNQTITISGVVTGSGTNAITTSFAASPTFSGTVTATTFSGSGASLTSIPQAAVTSLVSDLALKAPLASPVFTGTPSAPTAAVDANTTQLATTAYVINQGYLKSATASSTYLALVGGTLTGKVNTVASAAGGAGFNLPHGAAPTSPTNGDVWTTTAGMYVRVNGTTVGPFGTGAVWGSITGTLSSQTDLQNALNAKQNADNDLTAIAGLAGTSGFLKKTATDTWTLDTSTYLTGNQTITLSGVVIGSGTTAITTSFASSPTFTGTASFQSASLGNSIAIGSGSYATDASVHAIQDYHSIIYLGSSGSTYKNIIRGIKPGGTWASKTASSANDELLRLEGIGYGTSAFASAGYIQISLAGSGTFSNTSMPGAIKFWTTPNGSTVPTQRLVIDEIGMATFSGNINVQRDWPVIAANGTATKNGGFILQVSGVGRWDIGGDDSAESGSNAGSNLRIIRRSDAGANLGDALVINRATGKVDIGGNLENTGAGSRFLAAQSTDNNGHVYVSGANGFVSQVELRTGGVARWAIRKENTTESGSDAGSNLVINRYSDAGTLLGTALSVVRSTGRVIVGSVGASAGIELGSSGPRIMSGSGNPEGTVDAPIGSEWRDTATGIRYDKMSSGTTGWAPSLSGAGYVEDSQVYMMMGAL